MTKVRINIGGQVFLTKETTLCKYPNTRLACLRKNCDEYNVATDEYYFDRDPELFRPILNLCRGQRLHLPTHICGKAMRQELEFWQISEDLVSECCWKVLYKADRNEELAATMHKIDESSRNICLTSIGATGRMHRFKHRLWMIVSRPKSSVYALVFNSLYLLMVLVSVSVLVVQTHRAFRVATEENSTNELRYRNITNPILRLLHETTPHPALLHVDNVCAVFFTIEFLLHFLATPHKVNFIKNVLNLIDLLVLVCNWTTLVIEFYYAGAMLLAESSDPLYTIYIRFKYVSVLRILRFFKLIHRFASLHIMLLSVKKSFWELAMMTICILIIATLFGGALYIAELAEATVPDIPRGIWWAIITMTTVGYGDVVPKTGIGRFVGSLCAVTGLLALSMPIAIIASNFNEYYMKNRERDRLNYKRGYHCVKESCPRKVEPLEILRKTQVMPVLPKAQLGIN